MKKSYDFSKSIKNPYLKKPKKQLTIRLDQDTIDYFVDYVLPDKRTQDQECEVCVE